MRCLSRSLLPLILLALAAGCSPGPRAAVAGASFSQALSRPASDKPRVMWLAAHPDDESVAGGMLAQACVRRDSVCHFFVFNKGAGGECLLPEGCEPDLATVRHGEMVSAAHLYHATLETHDFYNAPLPFESFPTRAELQARWMREGDPIGLVARAIRRFRPDVVLSHDPYRGFTGHPEHQAASRFVIAGIRLAAQADADNALLVGEPVHRVPHLFHILNKYWFAAMVGNAYDPPPYSEILDSTLACDTDAHGRVRSCLDVQLANTRPHRSQDGDMSTVRGARRFLYGTYIRRVDPFGAEADELMVELDRATSAANEGEGT